MWPLIPVGQLQLIVLVKPEQPVKSLDFFWGSLPVTTFGPSNSTSLASLSSPISVFSHLLTALTIVVTFSAVMIQLANIAPVSSKEWPLLFPSLSRLSLSYLIWGLPVEQAVFVMSNLCLVCIELAMLSFTWRLLILLLALTSSLLLLAVEVGY